MRLLYAKSNTLLRIFNHCITDIKLVLFDSYYTSLFCPSLWTDYMIKRTNFMVSHWGHNCIFDALPS